MTARIVVDAASEAAVEAFGVYQRRERRLAELSVQMSSYGVRAFLAWRAATGRGDLAGLSPDELAEFVIHESGRVARSTTRQTVTNLRGFVRF